MAEQSLRKGKVGGSTPLIGSMIIAPNIAQLIFILINLPIGLLLDSLNIKSSLVMNNPLLTITVLGILIYGTAALLLGIVIDRARGQGKLWLILPCVVIGIEIVLSILDLWNF